jgi:hypothetical protein
MPANVDVLLERGTGRLKAMYAIKTFRVFVVLVTIALMMIQFTKAGRMVRPRPANLRHEDSSSIQEHHVDAMAHEEMVHHLRQRKIRCEGCEAFEVPKRLKAAIRNQAKVFDEAHIDRHHRRIDAHLRHQESMHGTLDEHHKALQAQQEHVKQKFADAGMNEIIREHGDKANEFHAHVRESISQGLDRVEAEIAAGKHLQQKYGSASASISPAVADANANVAAASRNKEQGAQPAGSASLTGMEASEF